MVKVTCGENVHYCLSALIYLPFDLLFLFFEGGTAREVLQYHCPTLTWLAFGSVASFSALFF